MWVTINSEFVAEEIVRAIAGSLALVLAVPITTALASRLLRRKPDELPETMADHGHAGHHHH
jgi:uncharacterized membrane protein